MREVEVAGVALIVQGLIEDILREGDIEGQGRQGEGIKVGVDRHHVREDNQGDREHLKGSIIETIVAQETIEIDKALNLTEAGSQKIAETKRGTDVQQFRVN